MRDLLEKGAYVDPTPIFPTVNEIINGGIEGKSVGEIGEGIVVGMVPIPGIPAGKLARNAAKYGRRSRGGRRKRLVDNAPKGVGKYLADNWHQGTFPNRMQSVRYHLAKHGKGRTAQQYTEDAMDFFHKNKHLGQKVTLKDGTPGIKIQTKIKIPGQKTRRIGGYWTHDGKLVTFWD
ncbi:MAG: hypothetical protein KatS3mg111_2963 [Pirellulaceae bacterium]|nr:MAG: hypothetical protein KatS3mg111_2963 [Pirellulaceae bacterium]